MIIPIYPEYISLNDWAGRLIEDDIHDQLPMLESEDKWKDWASNVAATPYFTSLNIPSPEDLGENITWQDWAKQFYALLIEQNTPAKTT